MRRVRRPLWPLLIGGLVLALELVYWRGYYLVTEDAISRRVEKVEQWQAVRKLPLALRSRGRIRIFPQMVSVGTDYSAAPFPMGLDYLGAITCLSDAASCGVLTIPPRDVLWGICKVVGYGGNDIISHRYNGDAGANYWDRHILSAAGAIVWTNVQTASTTLCRLAGTALTTGRVLQFTIVNRNATTKGAVMQTGDLTGAAATVGRIDVGACEWVNTTSPITTIEVLTAGGATLLTDTECGYFGRNL